MDVHHEHVEHEGSGMGLDSARKYVFTTENVLRRSMNRQAASMWLAFSVMFHCIARAHRRVISQYMSLIQNIDRPNEEHNTHR